MDIQAIGERVILEQIELETTTSSGIIIQTDQTHRLDRALVLSVGTACKYVKVGQTVTFTINNKDFGKFTTDDGRTLVILKEDQITGIVQ